MEIYGPVPSWRLGNSLGIDLISPPSGFNRKCPFACIYCQLGDNGLKSCTQEGTTFNPEQFDLLAKKIAKTKPDFITFSGKGEPTLNSDLGKIARKIRETFSIPVAVLTNAFMVGNPAVRNALDECDLVIAKIDAATQELFEKINRPAEDIKLSDIIAGISLLKTKVSIQTLLFSYNVLTNADEKSIKELIRVYKKIYNTKPINIFLGTAYRPSSLLELKTLPQKELKQIAWQITHETGIEVIYYQGKKSQKVPGKFNFSELEREVFELLQRRPCTEEELLSRFGSESLNTLATLCKKAIVEEKLEKNSKYFFLIPEK
ncbi:radical SAM protein [Candidatus Riflebacteria bacterium]